MDEVGDSGQILPDESPDPAGLPVHHLVVGSADVVSGGRLFPLIYGLYCRVAYFVESFRHFPQIVIRGSIF